MAELTPMMKQYLEIKNKHKDYIIFYRLGDFYEMFFEDAVLASNELELTLTGRDCGQEEKAPMCGVPYHSAEAYIGRLMKKGYKVAICEQVEDPKKSKGLVKREIVRMITPGTLVESSMLDEDENNFLGCIFEKDKTWGLCFCDISTGEVYASEIGSPLSEQEVLGEIGRFYPREVLLGGETAQNSKLCDFIKKRLMSVCTEPESQLFDENGALDCVCEQFDIQNVCDAGIDETPVLVCALGGLIRYLQETNKNSLASLNTLNVYRYGQYMELDLNARRNLELCETMRSKEKKGSLLSVIDKTNTSMGSRLIRQWLEKPLVNPVNIRKRQEAVAELVDDIVVRNDLTQKLSKVLDMQRLIGRIVYANANARDLCALKCAIEQLPDISKLCSSFKCSLLTQLYNRIDLLEDIYKKIECTIVDEPPVSIKEGGIIREGYHEEIDRLRDLSSGGKGDIAAIEQRERENTGIKNLKIGYNRVFGYYFEVSKSNLNLVPQNYTRKQTLANCERFITEELKNLESTVLGAQERLNQLEYELFCKLRVEIASEVHRIQRTAQSVATLDVLVSFAQLAFENAYVCPEVDFSGKIEIVDGRHPVVEKMLENSFFVPNDTMLDAKSDRTAIITGPNMAGKSTYMRQVALITIMAQIGSFVPAKSARIGVCDRVFTRVGASDDLASGQSTFMVEMSEVADILNNATKDSLVILDEIGRGTSTYDGMSIARAVVEYVTDKRKIGARTLFATHYHELTALEELLEGVKNYNIAVKKRGEDVTFLRKIVRGGADDSYGIEVAKLAGVPSTVIKRAKSILADLEKSAPKTEIKQVKDEMPQMTMEDLGSNEIINKLRNMQIDVMTPLEAMNALYELKKLV